DLAAPARAQPARGNDGRAPTVAAFESGPSKGAFKTGQPARPPRCAQRELLQPRGTDAVRHAIMARFNAEPQRPTRLELDATTQTDRRVSVRIAAATHHWRDRRGGGASAGEYLGPAGDGLRLAGREPQRGAVGQIGRASG